MRAGFARPLGIALLWVAASARAEHRVDFQAERLEISPEVGELSLSGKVVVRLARFRMTSGAMRLSRSARGVHVEGEGQLGLCPCASPPLTFDFRSADLAPPTDVLMQGATVRVGGVPVFWSPYLWLRSPERAGVIPPSLAYRGEEGVLVGSGVHVPFANEGRPHGLDLGLSGYLRGGGRLNLVLDTSHGRTAAELDYFRSAALDVASSYSAAGGLGQSFASRIDWLRGERAAVAPSSLARVALPRDRLRAAVGTARDWVFGVGVFADSVRASDLTELGVVGPGFVLGSGGALGRRARYGASLGGRSAHSGAFDLFLARAELGLSSSASLGPLLVETLLRERAESLTLGHAHLFAVRSELRARAAFPLLRRYSRLTHSVEPFTEAAMMTGESDGASGVASLPELDSPRRALLALVGMDTALAANGARAAADLRLAGGLSASANDTEAVLAARTRLDAGSSRFAAELRSVLAKSATELALRAELGHPGQMQLGLRFDGASGDTRATHGVLRNDSAAPASLLFARRGFGAGGRLSLPWGRTLSTELGADVDISAERSLSSNASAAYRHSCRCLSLALFGSRRLGRRGFELGVNLELAPR